VLFDDAVARDACVIRKAASDLIDDRRDCPRYAWQIPGANARCSDAGTVWSNAPTSDIFAARLNSNYGRWHWPPKSS
jgi:hypothetical protein